MRQIRVDRLCPQLFLYVTLRLKCGKLLNLQKIVAPNLSDDNNYANLPFYVSYAGLFYGVTSIIINRQCSANLF